ncbi:MAG: Glycosyl transferase, family 9, partial [uncultured bacterium]
MIDIQSVNHILISRTDNIGDVILTLPLAIQFKQMYPNIKITFLAQDYTRALVEACPAIDEFLSWNVLSSMKQSEAIKTLQDKKLDCIIHAFPNKEIARLAKKAKIPYRIGTRRRWYHFIYCNDRINFSRAKSELHEMQLNMKLLSAFHIRVQDEINDLSQLNFLKIHTALPERLKKFLSPDRFNLIIHPLSNGNSREWPISNFIALIK